MIQDACKACDLQGMVSKNGEARVFTYRIRDFATFDAHSTWVPFEMTKIASASEAGSSETQASDTDAVTEPEFKPLTAEEAQAWRLKNRSISPWRIIAVQVGFGAVMVVLTWLLTDEPGLVASVAWGVVAVVIPAMVFARALSRQMRTGNPKVAMVGLFVWELVKIVLTVALLLVAPKMMPDLSWLALVASFVVTIKLYWLTMALGWMQRKSKSTIF